ncbi:MAG: hypothetical protein ACO4CH_04845 [Saprospiraceae bacterium]|jgi:hypothetical protein
MSRRRERQFAKNKKEETQFFKIVGIIVLVLVVGLMLVFMNS